MSATTRRRRYKRGRRSPKCSICGGGHRHVRRHRLCLNRLRHRARSCRHAVKRITLGNTYAPKAAPRAGPASFDAKERRLGGRDGKEKMAEYKARSSRLQVRRDFMSGTGSDP